MPPFTPPDAPPEPAGVDAVRKGCRPSLGCRSIVDAARGSPRVMIHGRCRTLPAPAVNTSVSTSVTAQLGDRGSLEMGTRRIRRTRSSSDPPVAAIAIVVDTVRQLSSSASACA